MRFNSLFHETTGLVFSANEMRREGLDKSCCLSLAAYRSSAISNEQLRVTSSNGCQPAVSAETSLLRRNNSGSLPNRSDVAYRSPHPQSDTASHFHGAAPLRRGRVTFPFQEVCLKLTPYLLRKPLKSRISLGVSAGRGLLP